MTKDELISLIQNYADAKANAAIFKSKDPYTYPGSFNAAKEYEAMASKFFNKLKRVLKNVYTI